MTLFRKLSVLVLLALFLSACTTAPSPTVNPADAMPSYSQTLEAREQAAAPVASEDAVAPPAAAPATAVLNPLTGLPPVSAELLEHRPVLVKVQNLPRPREQWGVSFADIVYEYFTELGSTRFSAIFYGSRPDRVAPIRSARFFDMHLVRMYGANFVFGSAYADLLKALMESDFRYRLLLEQPDSCPAICRYDPNGKNYLTTNLPALQEYIQAIGMDDTAPDLQGMHFAALAPAGGQPATRVFTRFSAAAYNRWDYDPAGGRYLRFSDAQDDLSGKNEVYEPLSDQLTGQQIAAENVVVILAEYVRLVKTEDSEVYDINLKGSGMAYGLRDGQLYNLHWRRAGEERPLELLLEDGSAYPFKPGQTWFEVMGINARIERDGEAWRFVHIMP